MLDEHADKFAAVVGDADIIRRVKAKLGDEPVEDLRIDFEDGYVGHGADEEDEHVRTAAHALAESQQSEVAPAFTGIRIKSFEAPTRARGVRTLTHFLSSFAEAKGDLDGFVVTLPKVTSTEQVVAFCHAAQTIEDEVGLADGAIRFEVQVETPQTVLGPDGTALVARIVHTSDGRLSGLHYGTYDYSAYLGIAAGQQSLEHPAADHAKLVMQAAAAGTGVRLSDGSTNVLPVGDGDTVHRAWELHLRLVTRALERGLYQGWDLHPGQLPTRYAATYAFFRAGLPRALERLEAYGEPDHPASQSGAVADEPATARALADYVLRGLDCGAVDADEVTAGCGLGDAELRRLAHR
jgi:citrate lyase beta subunit